jgi:hypothetical protein
LDSLFRVAPFKLRSKSHWHSQCHTQSHATADDGLLSQLRQTAQNEMIDDDDVGAEMRR